MGGIFRLLRSLESGLLVLVLAVMILASFSQILLRNVFDSGVAWIGPMLRHLVLWIALLGAMLASRSANHLAVDVVNHFLSGRLKSTVKALTCAFTSLVCLALAWASILFVRDEMEFGMKAFAGIDSWIPELILPLGFSVMGVRYLLFTLRHCRAVATGQAYEPEEPDQGEGEGQE